jgi:putative hydrolase of the HAD superfamily
MAKRPIRVVTFDADDTLWDFTSVMRRSLGYALEQIAIWHPKEAQSLSVSALAEIRNGVAAEPESESRTLEEIRHLAFVRTLERIGVPDAKRAAELNDLYLRHRFEDIELFEDVLPVLRDISQTRRIGIVSNGNTLPDRVGLGGVFSFTVFAEECGARKPDPEIFRIAAEAAGCAIGEMLHVGDSLYSDIGGAQAAGVRSVWLKRSGEEPTEKYHPDAVIADLYPLPGLIASLETS